MTSSLSGSTTFLTTATGDRVGLDRRGDGPAVVFVAGAGPFRAIDPETTAVAELLAARGHTTVVHDRVGRGDSLRPGRVTLADERAALAAILDEVAGLGPVVLCGHSSGAAIALHAAATGLPVAGVVLFEAPLDPADPDADAWIAELDRLLDADRAEAAVRHYMKDIPLEVLDGLESSPLWAPFVAHAQSLRADAEAIAWTRTAPLAEVLAPVTVPVRVLVGRETFPVMPVAAAALVAALPDATQGEVDGVQHSWEPAAMADELATFAAGLPA